MALPIYKTLKPLWKLTTYFTYPSLDTISTINSKSISDGLFWPLHPPVTILLMIIGLGLDFLPICSICNEQQRTKSTYHSFDTNFRILAGISVKLLYFGFQPCLVCPLQKCQSSFIPQEYKCWHSCDSIWCCNIFSKMDFFYQEFAILIENFLEKLKKKNTCGFLTRVDINIEKMRIWKFDGHFFYKWCNSFTWSTPKYK